jgi:hypothetical protein
MGAGRTRRKSLPEATARCLDLAMTDAIEVSNGPLMLSAARFSLRNDLGQVAGMDADESSSRHFRDDPHDLGHPICLWAQTAYRALLHRPRSVWIDELSQIHPFGSATGSAKGQNHEDERHHHQHPARMAAARRPQVRDSAEHVKAAHERTECELRVAAQPDRRANEGETAQEPGEGAQMQEQRHEPVRRRRHPTVRGDELPDRLDHPALDQDAMDHRHEAADPSR